MTALAAKLEAIAQLTEAMQELKRRENRRRFFRMFPEADVIDRQSGEVITFARHKYRRHLEFFQAGLMFRERCFMAGNRVGKTVANSYEMTCHLTGLYPHWWEGRRFHRPINAWMAGKTNETVRDILQKEMMGEVVGSGPTKGVSGTGMVPGDLIGKPSWKSGVTDLMDTVPVKHVTGDWSTLGFKSYQQGRGSFEGTAQHVIGIDEECPEDVYGECLIRLATTKGLMMLTFTPLEGLTSVALSFMPKEMRVEL